MTGFGRAESLLPKGKITVEIKTVNHKFFDISLKMPSQMGLLEDKIKENLQKHIKRGKVYLNIMYDGAFLNEGRVVIDEKAAKRYYNEFSRLKKHIGLKDEIMIKDLIALPGVVNYPISETKIAALWPNVKSAIDKAVAKLGKDREKEGRALFLDMSGRAKGIKKMLAVIKSRAHLNIGEYRKRFADKVKDITGGRAIDTGRLEMETAIFAKNSDISEEVTRLASHIEHFQQTLADNGEIGKKLDFIAQELHREINTIGSKASDFKIARNVIEIKGEIEKIREQAKNLE
jgi:uncharacterized protein (TIGR00255 family)